MCLLCLHQCVFAGVILFHSASDIRCQLVAEMLSCIARIAVIGWLLTNEVEFNEYIRLTLLTGKRLL